MPFNKGKELKYEALKKNFTEFSRLCSTEDWLIRDAIRQSDKIAPIPALCPTCIGAGCKECNNTGIIV